MKTVLLIDADVLLHKAVQFAAVEVDWPDSFTSIAVDEKSAQSYLKREVARLQIELQAQSAILAVGDRTNNWRKQLEPTYKGNRAKLMGLGRRPPGFEALERFMEAEYEVVRWPRLEGDDVLGILATLPMTDRRIIVSIDKDLRTVPGWLYNPDKHPDGPLWIDPLDADRAHLELTLRGDLADGYRGCPGVGKVGAAKILDAAYEGPEEFRAQRRWEGVQEAFVKAGLTSQDALLQARLARVLRAGEYDPKTHKVRLWAPPE